MATLQDIQNGMLLSLGKVAAFFVPKMKEKRAQVNAPRNIDDAISVTSPVLTSKGAKVEVEISLEEAPAAAAFEWGSGEHATRGPRGKIRIVPKQKDVLAFLWPNAPPGFPVSAKTGKVVLKHVDHPGVEKRPYIRPTIEENTEEIKEILGKDFKASLLVGVKKVEVIS